MSASVPEISIEEMICNEKVNAGKKWIPNTHKKWYKFWTWFEVSGWYEDTFKNVQYVPSDKLLQAFFSPIQKGMQENKEAAQKYIDEEFVRVSDSFMQEIDMIEN
ncbi:MAG: hypothetical protein K2G25_02250, partial [Oscillospiraceae bacterium]|nr:hypothetical protein [Oscillospiraceae bacterium]